MSAKEVRPSSVRKPLRIASSVGGVTRSAIFGRSSVTGEGGLILRYRKPVAATEPAITAPRKNKRRLKYTCSGVISLAGILGSSSVGIGPRLDSKRRIGLYELSAAFTMPRLC